MAITISGSTGIAGVDGSANTPALQGTDTNTGLFYGTDSVSIATAGSERVKINSSGQIEVTAGSSSAPAITPTGDLNTGIYFPSADTIAFTEGGAQVGEFDSSANFKINSGYGSVATIFGCRAWVNFNGTGTIAIRGSGNVSSITDGGTGIYTVNFTNAMPDANYAVALGGDNLTGTGNLILNTSGSFNTTSIQLLLTTGGGGTLIDDNYVSVAVFR